MRAARRPIVGRVIWLLFASALTESVHAQIVTENAGTISPETPIVQTRFEHARAANVTDSRLVETFLWAPDRTRDFALSLPVIHRHVTFGSGGDGTLEGIGDAALRWKQSFSKVDDVMKSTRVSGLAGVTAPTGSWHDEVGGVEVPRKLELGTGSVGFFGGPLFTRIDDRHRFAAELIGRYYVERDGFELQPSLQLGLAYWYRLRPERLEIAGEKTEVRGVIEVTSIQYGESRLHGSGLGDRGNVTWLSPGVQIYPSLSWLFEASVQIPVVETIDDAQGDRKFGFLLNVKFLF